MIFAFFLLANIQNTLEFNTAISFILIYLVSVAFLFLISQNIDAKKHLEHLHTFWMNDINARQLIWIPIGIAGVFASVGVSIAVDFPLLGIFLSGGVMMFIFLKTNAILIPIIVHGIYNSFVISLKQGAFDIGATFLQQTPIRVSRSRNWNTRNIKSLFRSYLAVHVSSNSRRGYEDSNFGICGIGINS